MESENQTELIFKKRHSLAHILMMVVEKLYPEALATIGPVIENGFYYDIDFGNEIGLKINLAKIEKEMQKIIALNLNFTRQEISEISAKEKFAKNKYKLELIGSALKSDNPILTTYSTGNEKFSWTDLCEGPHIENTKEILEGSWKLDRVAGAYWRGSEKNAMLTRIYGLAFENKEMLDTYLLQQAEAKKRDHRLLGEQLDLFMISEEVGKGLPLYLPNGAYIRKKLEDLMYEKESAQGYNYVYTPILTHKRLYEQSGHLDHYHEDMYNPIEIEGEEYYLRPMNCPHHHQIFKHRQLSYRDLPLRLAESGLVHRFERSGVLTGLIRARCFTQNDAHIYCAKTDIKQEIINVLSLFREVYDDIFDIKNYWFRLSLPDFENTEKFGNIENRAMWDEATEIVRAALEESGTKYSEGHGEAAFYGPKIDVQIRNVNGKEDTIATIQVDFYSAKRFGLTFTNAEGKKEEVVIIHRAIMGSFERFFSFLIEKYAGAFPTWLSPIQVAILPVGEKQNDYAYEVEKILRAAGIKAQVDAANDMLGKKVRRAKEMKVPYFLVLGEKEMQANIISVESRDRGRLGDLTTLSDLLIHLQHEIKDRK